MARFLTAEWACAFNEVMASVDRSEMAGLDGESSLAAEGGEFTVHQIVVDAPGGDIDAVLTVDATSVKMSCGPRPAPGHLEAEIDANVTVSLTWESAVALSQGLLPPGKALADGQVRVRGDLAVLIASQQLLASIQPRLQELQSATTY